MLRSYNGVNCPVGDCISCSNVTINITSGWWLCGRSQQPTCHSGAHISLAAIRWAGHTLNFPHLNRAGHTLTALALISLLRSTFDELESQMRTQSAGLVRWSTPRSSTHRVPPPWIARNVDDGASEFCIGAEQGVVKSLYGLRCLRNHSACLKLCANPKIPCRCRDSALLLPSNRCHAIRDIRLLGAGNERTAWEARMSGPLCEGAAHLCQDSVVRKVWRHTSTSSLGHDRIWREAHFLHALQCEYGPEASLGFYGVCEVPNGTSLFMERTRVVSDNASWKHFTESQQGRDQLWRLAERMAAFPAGPLEDMDGLGLSSPWKQLGLNGRGQVHGIDLDQIQLHYATREIRKLVLDKYESLLLRRSPTIKSFDAVRPSWRKPSWREFGRSFG